MPLHGSWNVAQNCDGVPTFKLLTALIVFYSKLVTVPREKDNSTAMHHQALL